ncbi:hypothetical protein [Pseudarthrobacter sp. S3]|uniref:hypothetical protein n=1 Tax=Pseudarthrobacter sp. S3 TaxID=3418419 RepID=UPI003CEF068F
MKEGTQLNDNYAQFIARLDAATQSLSSRRDSLSTSLEILVLLADQNRAGLLAWEQRRANTSKLLEKNPQRPEAESLRELLEVALRMEPMFRNRTERIGQRLALLGNRSDELTKSLVELEKSKTKLDSSRMLAQERDNLSRAVAQLAGTAQGPFGGLSDAGLLDDLKKAREAIVLAEALLEVKGK